MKNLFRSRLPPTLTSTQINKLADESHLSAQDIEEWYQRFNSCYPCGYLSYKEFISYLKTVKNQNGNDSRITKSVVKQLYRVLDLNQDKKLNFEEFFLFNIVLNQGSFEDKFKLTLDLYDREKEKYLTRAQLERILVDMFDLLNLSKAKDGLSQRIDEILTSANFNNKDNEISWHTFSTYVRNNQSLFATLISKDIGGKKSDDDFTTVTARF
ncbi:unnamed protein product [Rotaria socialis]|uniref:EF-hand domain-containing protein n=1 Tax=Rotaria socialis TaxID=392032 RepID=A0A820HF29_9BILA|nr:unnamed protein product [Rotaria socialis]CAF3325186.1 unnamed protein product [Rotaria socialis]CAF3557217.1 unnamed protein product [Rotaria socialis]CAF3575770.1 unnamed protein product [Rotaria socialis]CAF3767110.1 unnamed protein product [Rotaria socialis]